MKCTSEHYHYPHHQYQGEANKQNRLLTPSRVGKTSRDRAYHALVTLRRSLGIMCVCQKRLYGR